MVNQATTVVTCPLSEGDQNKIIREKEELEILIVNLPLDKLRRASVFCYRVANNNKVQAFHKHLGHMSSGYEVDCYHPVVQSSAYKSVTSLMEIHLLSMFLHFNFVREGNYIPSY